MKKRGGLHLVKLNGKHIQVGCKAIPSVKVHGNFSMSAWPQSETLINHNSFQMTWFGCCLAHSNGVHGTFNGLWLSQGDSDFKE